MSDQAPKPLQFSLLKLLGYVGVLYILCALLSPAIQDGPPPTRRQHCLINLKQIGIALHNYHDVYDSFPQPVSGDASGEPLHSWRMAIAPFIEKTDLVQQYDLSLPWDHSTNLTASAPFAHHFICLSAEQPPGSAFTNYVMVVGQKRAAGSGTTKDHPNAIIVVEIADSDIHWTEPRDLNFDEMSFKINDKTKPSISSHHVHGAMVVYADGSVHFLDESTDPGEVKELLTENLEDASGRGKRQP